MMTFEYYKKIANNYSTIPVYRKVLADLLTPVSAYMRLVRHHQSAVLLESVEGGKQYARYSYICIDPIMSVTHSWGLTTIQEGSASRQTSDPYLAILRNQIDLYDVPQLEELPSFCGGWVGYLGYETIAWSEDIPIHPALEDDVPDAIFMLFTTIMIFDHLKHEIIICHISEVDNTQSLRSQYDAALAKVDEVGEALHTDIDYQTPPTISHSHLETQMTRPEFKSAVKKAKDFIYAGDVFQLVLSQRFQRTTQVEPLTIYRALRNINPSPYMFFYYFNDFAIIGASPELLVKMENRRMEVRPIAGTRPRGKDSVEDAELADELLADEKELAEHVMLVDLGRNDVGRVSQFNSITITEFMTIERYSHVMHIVSDVQGDLLEGKDAFDALIAGFPAGTVTGAPKIRAMELIHELEPGRRGIYSGTLGYIDFHGNLNTCIAIRTMLVKDGVVSFQSGAGIVADSDEDKEYQETLDKAEGIMRAVDFAERGLE